MYGANFVFGYGSLMNLDKLQQYLGRNLTFGLDFKICRLRNFHRCWNIAMDNRLNLPHYKYYIDPETGNRPESFVTFLNIYPNPSKTITGILFRVSPQELKKLDQRERNYQRIDVTKRTEEEVQGKVWVYIGLKEAKQRYQEGLKQKNGMIAQDYIDSIHYGYRLWGQETWLNYVATTDEPTVPILNLKSCRVEGKISNSKGLFDF